MDQFLSDSQALKLLAIVWSYFPLTALFGLVTGAIPARGGKGGRPGFGHIARRDESPSTFWMTVILHLGITGLGVYLYATDYFAG